MVSFSVNGAQIDVLDNGFVRLIDVMGGDKDIADNARISYKSTAKSADADKRLIRRLMLDRHTSPFESVVFKFHVKAPIFVVRQWFRHRTWSYNEMSGRYRELPTDFYVPSKLRLQSKTNKQGSDGVIESEYAGKLKSAYVSICTDAFSMYHQLLLDGVSRELARIVLPLSTYTEFIGTVDLHNLFHFLELRTAPDAQWEIQEYARAIQSIVATSCPQAYEAWQEMLKRKSEADDLRDRLTKTQTTLDARLRRLWLRLLKLWWRVKLHLFRKPGPKPYGIAMHATHKGSPVIIARESGDVRSTFIAGEDMEAGDIVGIASDGKTFKIRIGK